MKKKIGLLGLACTTGVALWFVNAGRSKPAPENATHADAAAKAIARDYSSTPAPSNEDKRSATRLPNAQDFERIAFNELRYAARGADGTAYIDDPVHQRGYTVKEGDKVLGYNVESVSESAVELKGPDDARTLAYQGSTRQVERPIASHDSEIPSFVAPGVDAGEEPQRLKRQGDIAKNRGEQHAGEGRLTKGKSRTHSR